MSSNQPKSDLGLDAYLVPHFTNEEQKHALALMVRAHSACLLPSTLNDTSISLKTDSATLPTGESFVAVTGHWIDRVTSDTSGKCNWKLLSTVLAVSVENQL